MGVIAKMFEQGRNKFSIILPVYNAELYLRPCLDSVLAQTYADWECVCVDDGSSDGSAAIIDEYAEKDNRFRVIHQANQGVAVARNVGLDVAQGEWVTWLDADDLYAPWRLEEAALIVERNNPDLIHFKFEMSTVHEEGEWRRGSSVFYEGAAAKEWAWNVMLPMGMMWTMVMRRTLFVDNRFTPGMCIKEECPVCARIANRVERVVQSESRAYFYRQIPTSAMKRRRTAQECVQLLEAVSRIFQEGSATTRIAQARLRVHCEDDIIDWALNHQDPDGDAAIRSKYLELKAHGVFNAPALQRYRYRLPMWWLDKTGRIELIRFVAWMVAVFRKIVARFVV